MSNGAAGLTGCCERRQGSSSSHFSRSYVFRTRVATPNSGTQLQLLKADGSVITSMTLPSTDGWQNWKTDSTTVSLQAGIQKLRIYSKSGVWNINWIEFSPTSQGGATTGGGGGGNGLTRYVKVQVYGGQNPYQNSEWNNWNVGTASSSNISSNP